MRKLIFIFIFVFCFLVNFTFADSEKFGVIIGQGKAPGIIEILKDLGVSWVRLNNHLDGKGGDISQFLKEGFNVVITVSNRDPNNLDETFGSSGKFNRGGFPFKSKEVYQKRIKELLEPLLPYLKGRKIMLQCENEIVDVTWNPKTRYWRGTTQQYLKQLDAFYEAVKSVNPSIPVVLTSFASETLSILTNPADPKNKNAVSFADKLLKEGKYDVTDLHFYGCVEDIPKKISWLKEHMPSGKKWISTENGGPDFRCSSTSTPYEKNPKKFEEIQAKQVSQRLSACADNGGSVCLWFSLIDLRGEANVFSHMGLLEVSGFAGQKGKFKGMRKRGKFGKREVDAEKLMQALRKKPAYEAFKSFVGGAR